GMKFAGAVSRHRSQSMHSQSTQYRPAIWAGTLSLASAMRPPHQRGGYMKRFLLLVMVAAPLTAQSLTQPPPETITVNGTGHATLTPDRFTFTAGVQSMAPTVEEAVNENNTKMNAVVAALKKAGATDQEVRTSNFLIFPQQVYEQGKAPHIVGYQANNTVIVTKKDVAAASKLLQVALSAGVNETSNLNFEVSDPARGREQGLR